jgi:hypothetical protein
MTAVEIRAERGFAESGVPQAGLIELFYGSGSGETESFTVRDGWGDNGSNGFWQ